MVLRRLVWKARRRRAVTQRSHNAPCLFAVWSRFTQEKIARLSARSTRGVFGDLWAVRVTSVSRKSEKTPGQNGLLAACKTLEMDRAWLEFSLPRRDVEATHARRAGTGRRRTVGAVVVWARPCEARGGIAAQRPAARNDTANAAVQGCPARSPNNRSHRPLPKNNHNLQCLTP